MPAPRAMTIVASGLMAALVTSARASGTYEVFPIPLENPDDGPRTVEVDPDLSGGDASPFGWHDTDGAPGPEYTVTRGNNVYAYLDTDGDDVPDVGGSPDGGPGLSFLFPLDLGQPPSAYQEASVTNAFYWTNVIHDVLYNAGFDEEAGNFQESGYGRGGVGGDPVLLEVQEGSALNNAFIEVLPDGQSPRFEICIFTPASPDRDSALSSLILGFQYGRAMALRVVGGSETTSCLTAAESEPMSYGWGDWLAIVLTARAGDTGPDRRAIAPYLLDEPPTGNGVRPTPYSTSFAVHPGTYHDIAALGTPQNVGWIWAEMLWEVYWELVDAHGFSPDLNADPSLGGNVLALHLVVDAMKRLPCQPGFVDGRDALLEADLVLTGGENCERIWSAFARRGLGFSADQGSSSSTSDGTEAFDVPPASDCEPVLPVELTSDEGAVAPGPRLAVASPFQGHATIALTTLEAGPVRIRLFDVSGRELSTLVDQDLAAGSYRWEWSPAPETEGEASVYFLEARTPSHVSTRKLIRVR